MARDRWAEWILERRFGGSEQSAPMFDALAKVRDRVLERAEIQPGETVLDVGCGDGLIAFGALERVGFLAYVRPRYDAREMTGRQAVAYLRARRLMGSGGTAGTGR
ncbi:MAG: class I SAM-dependent methyltransferase [Actinomycetota bacterium]|nr:class I SAM-dependent methyltransferase [Actinomycetota bacterium]